MTRSSLNQSNTYDNKNNNILNNNTNTSLSTGAELRQMSNPIPISTNSNLNIATSICNSGNNSTSVNTFINSSATNNSNWQIRFNSNNSGGTNLSQQQLDDSTQFDPGIMEQCISHSSVSPASAASYSLSPSSFAFNLPSISNPLVIFNSNRSSFNENSTFQHHQLNQQIQSLEFTNSSNNENSNSQLFTGAGANVLLISNPNSNSNSSSNDQQSTSATSSSSNRLALSYNDLESLLVNTTLSDTSNYVLSNSSHQVVSNEQSSSDLADDDNVNNQINPMFLFKTNMSDLVDFNNNNCSSSSSSSPKSTNQKSANNRKFQHAHKQQRNNINKIDEEQDSDLLSSQEQYHSSHRSFSFVQHPHHQQNYNTQTAMSLPSQTSFLSSKFNAQFDHQQHNVHQQAHHHFNQLQSNQQHQRSDPVLTQLILNPTTAIESTPSAQAQFHLQQQQQQQQQQINNNLNYSNQLNNVYNNQNNSFYQLDEQMSNMYSTSLPANYSINNYTNMIKRSSSPFSNEKSPKRASTSSLNKVNDFSDQNHVHIKSERMDPILANNQSTSEFFDDNDEKFAKLKLSSPLNNTNSSSLHDNLSESVSPSLDAINSCMFDIDDHTSAHQLNSSKMNNDQLNFNELFLDMNNSSNNNHSGGQHSNTDTSVLKGYLDVNQLANELKFDSTCVGDNLINICDEDDALSLDLVKTYYCDNYEQNDDNDDDDDEEDDEEEDEDDDDEDEDEDDDAEETEEESPLFFKSKSTTKSTNKKGKREQQVFCVGSVGSALAHKHQKTAVAINTRKQARLNASLSGVDVHHTASNQSLNQQRVLNANDSKNIFSNLCFEPFSSQGQHQQTQQQFQSPQLQQQQQQQPHQYTLQGGYQQSFMSTSLPPVSKIDSFMNNFNAKANQNQTQKQTQVYASSQNHPNLNKLLLSNTNSTTQLTSSNVKSILNKKTRIKQEEAAAAVALTASSVKLNSVNSAKPNSKKRHKKQQELFDDDFEEDDEDGEDENENDDEDESDLGFSDSELRSSVKMEQSDFDSGDSVTAHRKASGSNRNSNRQGSAPSSYINSESLFDLMMSSKNRDSYFWQYNIQSKGPKTKKVLTLRNKDPHLHRDFYDPVFQLQSLNARGGTSLNKLRKGDGNDVTPNAEKLYNLGNQIRDFIQKSYQMNSACFTSSSSQRADGPLALSSSLGNGVFSASLDNGAQGPERVNLKREKNKIASRACRLKKKAQHEANKIKLFGLNDEHKQLIECINSSRDLIRKRLTEPSQLPADKKMVDLIDDLIKQKIKTKVAGNSDGYVHSLMLAIEKQRSLNQKSNIKLGKNSQLIDLNQFNAQYSCSTTTNQSEASFNDLAQHQHQNQNQQLF